VEGWKSVEEGGESLKNTCKRLFEERVSSKSYLLDKIHANAVFI